MDSGQVVHGTEAEGQVFQVIHSGQGVALEIAIDLYTSVGGWHLTLFERFPVAAQALVLRLGTADAGGAADGAGRSRRSFPGPPDRTIWRQRKE